jgi:hypothetical protein
MRQRATAVVQMVRRLPRVVWAGMLERKFAGRVAVIGGRLAEKGG